jgi:arylsulfatase A-like enzyme
MKKISFNILGCLFIAWLLQSCSNDKERKPSSEIPKKPNIVVIMTDQERYAMHWPQGWAEKHLVSFNRLKKHGLTFHRAYTAACECAPSRAVLMSSEHYPVNQVPRTPPSASGLPSAKELMDIGSLLKEHGGYEVVWKGKWHLSLPLDGGYNWTEKDIANMQERYDIYSWTPPDAGNAIQEFEKNTGGKMFNGLTTLGGGFANNDGRYIYGYNKENSRETPGWGKGVIDYLKGVSAKDADARKPFCLFVSLVNPHDVWVYPSSWEAAGYKKEDFEGMGVELPSNHTDDLTTKPSIQLKARRAYNAVAPINDQAAAKEYVNFYAYLNKKADGHIETILDTLDALGLTENTIIIRTSDHGELGFSHGMREKSYTVYEEMIHIPLIISNPKMYPTPQETDSFYCHLDLLPTLAELAGIPNFEQYGKGTSVVPVLKQATASVQDSILFTYDDVFFLPADTPGSHIRALREGDWTYAVYYSEDGSHFEYEMYNLKDDPGQLHNLLNKDISPEIAAEAKRLHRKLKEKIDQSNALPKGFSWPAKAF